MKALVVMSEGRCLPLVASLEAWGVKSCVVQDCQEAHPLIVADAELRMILTEESLPDGSWRDLAQASAANKIRVPVVVCLRHPNGGRADVLKSGALVLVEPFEFKSVQPVVAQAAELWRRWNGKWPGASAYSDDAKPPAASRGRGEVRPSRQTRRRVNSRL